MWWSLIKLFRIPFRLHPLFVLIMFTSILTGHFLEIITLFGIVFIHELGHVWAAKEAGWSIREIQMLPFGGVLEVDQQGNSSPGQEIFVALAGPFQHLWMILFAFGLEAAGIWSAQWSSYFIQANVIVALFNLIPILPLDGGKVMQALLSLILPYYRTLIICTMCSLVVSGLIIVYTLYSIPQGIHLNLLVIGLFLFFSNWYEYRLITFRYIRFLTNRIHAERSSERITEPIFVRDNEKLHDVVRQFRKGKTHRIFIVDQKDQVKLSMSEQELLNLYFRKSAS